MGLATPETSDVANPDALVLCAVCQALPSTERRERRSQVMMRMLDESVPQRQRRHG
jgi:hypothetical protein